MQRNTADGGMGENESLPARTRSLPKGQEMRRIAVATSLALLAGFSPVLEATGSFSAAEPTATLQQVSVTIEPGGRVRYHFSAIAGSLAYTGEAVYDPLTRRAQE